jgi:hypothetical protein
VEYVAQERWLNSSIRTRGIELLEACPKIMEKFIQGEWFKFCCTFQGHHEEISMLFANNFDGFQTQVGDVIIHVTEHSIAVTCHLPVKGERWWKKRRLPADLCNQFLVAEHQNPDWSQGIPNKWLKEEWQSVLVVVQKYITCEGRFSTIHCYHMCFLMHLNGDMEMNLPFYLLKILTKMEKRIQSHPQTAHKSLFHKGLIKIMVMYALSEVQVSLETTIVFLRV